MQLLMGRFEIRDNRDLHLHRVAKDGELDGARRGEKAGAIQGKWAGEIAGARAGAEHGLETLFAAHRTIMDTFGAAKKGRMVGTGAGIKGGVDAGQEAVNNPEYDPNKHQGVHVHLCNHE